MNLESKGIRTIHGFILVLLLVAFSWIFIDLSWDLHDGMRTHKADLGQVAQAVWNSGQGRFVAMTDNGPPSSRLTDHVEPILAIISPILWLWRDVKALLLLQVLAAALGGWLIYKLALLNFASLLSTKEQNQIWQMQPLRSLTNPIALAVVFSFLLSPQIQNALLTEFHAAPLAVPLILWAFYAVEKVAEAGLQSKRGYWIQFAVATVLTAFVKEEMALLAAGLGAWAIYRLLLSSTTRVGPYGIKTSLEWRRILLPLALMIFSVIWFYLATFVIVPAHAAEVYQTAENPYWARYGALGNSPLDIVTSLFTQPGVVLEIISEPVRANYLWMLIATFGFLCLLAPEILLLSLPLLLANVLSEYPPQYYGEFHYSAPLVAYFGVSAIYGAKRLGYLIMRLTQGSSPSYQQMPAAASWVMAAMAMVRNSRTAIRPLLFGGIAFWVAAWGISGYLAEGRGPLAGRYDPVVVNAHHQLLDRFVDQVPWDAAVAATAAVHPHLALRSEVYQFPIGMPEFGEQGKADWALLDVTTNTDMAPGDLQARIMQMLAADWGVIDGADGFLLLKRGAPEKEIPDAFFDFVYADSTAAGPPERALTLVDVTADDWPRWRSTKITTIWQVGPNFEPERDRPKFAIHSPSGEQLYSYSDGTPTALIWLPPAQWEPGDVIKIETPALTLLRDWGVAVNASSTQRELAISDGRMTLVATYSRTSEDKLVNTQLPDLSPGGSLEAGGTSGPEWPADVGESVTRLDLGDSAEERQTLQLKSRLNDRHIWSSETVDLRMQWHFQSIVPEQDATRWTSQWTPFVHMRGSAEEGTVNVAQQDGLPRWFLLYDPEPWLAVGAPLWDWRQLTVPEVSSEADGRFDLVVGLYDPISGKRATVLDDADNPIGNEALLSQFSIVDPLVPDFACAMNAAACAALPIE